MNHGRAEAQRLAAIERNRRYGDDAIILGLCGRNLGTQVQREPPFANMRLQQGHDRGDGYLRLEGDAADPAIAGIEVWLSARLASVRPIVVAQGVAQLIVARRAAERLDVLMLVQRGDTLCGQLAADPIRFLDEMDAAAAPCGSERCGHAACSSAHDKHIALDLAGPGKIGHPHNRHGRVAVGRHPHDVHQRIETAIHGS